MWSAGEMPRVGSLLNSSHSCLAQRTIKKINNNHSAGQFSENEVDLDKILSICLLSLSRSWRNVLRLYTTQYLAAFDTKNGLPFVQFSDNKSRIHWVWLDASNKKCLFQIDKGKFAAVNKALLKNAYNMHHPKGAHKSPPVQMKNTKQLFLRNSLNIHWFDCHHSSVWSCEPRWPFCFQGDYNICLLFYQHNKAYPAPNLYCPAKSYDRKKSSTIIHVHGFLFRLVNK